MSDNEMRPQAIAIGLLFVLACTACGAVTEDTETSVPMSTAEVPRPISTIDEAETDLCEASTQESIGLLDAARNRVDRATTSAELDAVSDSIADLFTEAGESLGTNCGAARSGDALSELIVWASSAASTRPLASAGFAEGFLEAICELDVELTPPATIACAE